jgi:EmrB/QacA subfamily drug resistance transporter
VSAPSTPARPAMSHREVLVVFGALMAGMLLAALDQTIVATALPTIVGDLGGIDHLAWVVTAYLLTSTAATPLFGKVGDLYGRKQVFQAAILVFLLGSVLAGMSRNMPQLIGFRALQGIGGGGLMALAQAIVGDLVSPRERGRYQGYLGSVFAFASVAGPLLGGFFVDHFDWRWVFYINVPVGAAALWITQRTLHLPRHRVQHRVDYLGAALLVAAVTGLLLAMIWGGQQYPWSDPVIVGLLVGGVALAAAFLVVEHRAAEPILPLRLFRSPVFRLSSAAAFVVGASMFGAIVFLPLYLQVVTGTSATGSGLALVPLMAGMLATSITSGRRISATGNYKAWPIAGTALMTGALVLLSTMTTSTTQLTVSLYMVVLGAGIGMVMQVLILVAQNDADHRDLGVVTSAAAFFRSLGGSVGAAAFGAILTAGLGRWLPRLVPAGALGSIDPAALQGSPALIASLPEPVRLGVAEAFAQSIHTVFLVAVPVSVIAFLLVLFLEEKPLRDTVHVAGGGALEDVAMTFETAIDPDHLEGSPS